MGKSSVDRMGIPFKRFDELCGCEGVVTEAVECPFIGGCSLYFKKSLSPCLGESRSALGDMLLISAVTVYLRPTLVIGTPVRELNNLSSPPKGLFESMTDRESTSLGRFSRI